MRSLFLIKSPALFVLPFLALQFNTPALADICLEHSIDVTVKNLPDHFTDASTESLFDGSTRFSSEGAIRLHQPGRAGDNSLVFDMGTTLLADTSFDFFYTVSDAAGRSQSRTIARLNNNGYGASYFDRNRNGRLDYSDFDTDGNNRFILNSGDYAPIGFVVHLYNGEPGNPVGTGSGRRVLTAVSPIQLLNNAVHQMTITAPGSFDHLILESTPDDVGGDARITEIKINNSDNASTGGQVGGKTCETNVETTF
jgi:hypothetical protein